MKTFDLEHRLRDAFGAAREHTLESPDLFARVERTIAQDEQRRRWRRRFALGGLGLLAGFAALIFALADYKNGRITMSWWLIELLTTLVLVGIAVFLGPFIKRFGRSYAADVFRANPRTGKSYLVLTDVAYYLIFTAFILFTMTFEEFDNWKGSTGNQLKHEVARVGGILLMMGFLHAANVIALPMIGRMLTLNRRLDDNEDHGGRSAPQKTSSDTQLGFPLETGTWTIRVERAESTP